MRFTVICLFVALAGPGTAVGQSPFERELNQLQEQRDKALAVSAEPINRRYLLETIPPNTKKRAFHYRFKKDYPMIILRIRDHLPEDNQGFAVYDVTVGK